MSGGARQRHLHSERIWRAPTEHRYLSERDCVFTSCLRMDEGPSEAVEGQEPLLWAQSECPGVLWAERAAGLSWGPEAQGPQSCAVSGVGASLQGLEGRVGEDHMRSVSAPSWPWPPELLGHQAGVQAPQGIQLRLGLVAFLTHVWRLSWRCLTPQAQTGPWRPRVRSCSTWGLRPHPSTPSTEDMGPRDLDPLLGTQVS